MEAHAQVLGVLEHTLAQINKYGLADYCGGAHIDRHHGGTSDGGDDIRAHNELCREPVIVIQHLGEPLVNTECK